MWGHSSYGVFPQIKMMACAQDPYGLWYDPAARNLLYSSGNPNPTSSGATFSLNAPVPTAQFTMGSAFHFPPSPVIGQQVTAPNGTTYQWDGVKWVTVTFSPFVPIGGGTMTGPLILSGAPTDPNGAVNKTYADNLALDCGTF